MLFLDFLFFFYLLKSFPVVGFKNITFFFGKILLNFKNLFVEYVLVVTDVFLSSGTPFPVLKDLPVLILEKLNWNTPHVLVLDLILCISKRKNFFK